MPSSSPPNIVLVLTDDQRTGSMKRMPAVWSLIRRRGVRYPNAMAPTSLCCPSRASILTGLYAHHTRVYSNGLPDGGWQKFHERGLEERTLAVALHDVGYQTGMFGKYLNGSFPREAAAGYTPPGWDRMVTFTTKPGYFDYRLNDGSRHGSRPQDYSTDVLGAHAVDFIRDTPADQPLFTYFAPVGPHRPFSPAPRHAGAWAGRLPPHKGRSVTASVKNKPPWIRNRRRVPQKTIDAQIASAQEALMSIDEAVKDLVQALTDTGRIGNTMFIFMSDNGLMAGEHHLNPWKNVPYRWSTSVPMTIRWDGHLPANRTDRRLALNIDVATTIADAASATMSTDGLSLLRSRTRSGFPLEGGPWRRFDSLPKHPAYCGWRTKNWMYTQYATGEQELFHYRDDRHELRNLSEEPAHRARLKEMRAAAKAACKPVPPNFSWPRQGK